eukprot:CAMPEP_0184695140 /NCGR_PEP_ID=MMETSP0313-20130426/2873_1 /TAXON_ID=2792 /ORGANISM="Porphyridium aerugineum, Strain SAG 1380-2" /LENGTH=520 /DNA_ID=CAMNT_0027153541 /DNA_START=12 /DNA_END=1570 /DNA_ORIENTATION=+
MDTASPGAGPASQSSDQSPGNSGNQTSSPKSATKSKQHKAVNINLGTASPTRDKDKNSQGISTPVDPSQVVIPSDADSGDINSRAHHKSKQTQGASKSHAFSQSRQRTKSEGNATQASAGFTIRNRQNSYSSSAKSEVDEVKREVFEAIRLHAQNAKLVEQKWMPDSELEIDKYLWEFAMTPKDFGCEIDYLRGGVTSNEYKVVTHIFAPRSNKMAGPAGESNCSGAKAIFVLHGYNDHVGMFQDSIKYFVRKGYSVVAIDLPGHGLSSGKQNSIHNFREYGDAFCDVIQDVLELSRSNPDFAFLHSPWNIFAHSTGSTTVIEYLVRCERASSSDKSQGPDGRVVAGDPAPSVNPRKASYEYFDKIVLLAPLVRFVNWYLSKFGQIFHGVLDWVPARPPEKRTEARFKKFETFDVLQSNHVELEWVRAVYAWEVDSQDYCSVPRQLLVIQGERDNTVLWKHNMKFLETSLLPQMIKVLVPSATHQLINGQIRTQELVMELAIRYMHGQPLMDRAEIQAFL